MQIYVFTMKNVRDKGKKKKFISYFLEKQLFTALPGNQGGGDSDLIEKNCI